MKKHITLLAIIGITFLSVGQESFLINNTQLRFGVKPVLMNNLKLDRSEKNLKSYPALSFEAGIGVKQRLYHNFSLIVDAGYTLIRFHSHYNFEKEINYVEETHHTENFTETVQGMFVIPISFQYETLHNKKLNYFTELGLKFNIVDQYPYAIEAGSSYASDLVPPDQNGNKNVHVFSIAMENKTQEFFMSYVVKAGLIFTTKSTHTFNLALVANYCPTRMYKGNYSFFDNQPEDVSLGINYVGLECAFGLTLKKKNYML